LERDPRAREAGGGKFHRVFAGPEKGRGNRVGNKTWSEARKRNPETKHLEHCDKLKVVGAHKGNQRPFPRYRIGVGDVVQLVKTKRILFEDKTQAECPMNTRKG